MSLEAKIDTLTIAINNLTAALQAATVPPEQRAAVYKEAAPVIEAVKDVLPTVTHDQLTELCMTKTRANPESKAAIIAILAEHGVKTVMKLNSVLLPEVFAKVSAL